MAPLVRKVKAILRESFPLPDQVKLKEDNGILGMVISQRFEGLEPIERLNMVWKVLNEKLTLQESRQIVTLLAVTPEEELVHSD